MTRIRYGGDYNPEQWPPEIWDEDVRLMQEASVDLVTVGVFSWALLEPRDGEFDFSWLDDVLSRLHAGGIGVDLATATASPPPWLTVAHPEALPVTAEGVRLSVGSRQQYCPSSPDYRRHAARLVAALADRYAGHPAVEMWHVNNEYGCHVSHCYCDISAEAFRAWLRARYGTVEALNLAWGTAFWSQQYGDFHEVFPPRAAPAFHNPSQLVDFDRFSSDELLDCFLMEKSIIREHSDLPVTTNFMGFFKPADYWRWAREVDVIADDCYPDPDDAEAAAGAAMIRDLMRSLAGGEPWLLMEQAPSAVNWRQVNAPKRPGQYRALSMQAIARGADGILQFQWRQSVAGAEKFHSGMLPHAGTDSRVWREVTMLGSELASLEVAGGVSARVAIVLDWPSWWAVEQQAVPARTDYLEAISSWYRTLWDHDVPVDFVPADGPLSRYAVVIAPVLFCASDEKLRHLAEFTQAGGTLLVTYLSGIVDNDGHISQGGYLGTLRDTLGIWIEEFSPHRDGWAEVIRIVAAEVVQRFGDDGYGGGPLFSDLAGAPALTRAQSGRGVAWYVATMPDPAARSAVLHRVLAGAGVLMPGPHAEGVETIVRGGMRFVIDHHRNSVSIEASS
jgi:beta-galactosidase